MTTRSYRVGVHFRGRTSYNVEAESARLAEEEAALRFYQDQEGTSRSIDWIESAELLPVLPACGICPTEPCICEGKKS